MKAAPDTTVLAPCRLRYGAKSAAIDASDGPPALCLALPALAGERNDALFLGEPDLSNGGRSALFRHHESLAGLLVAAPDQGLESAATDLYGQLFALARDRHIYRIWNFVPQINRVDDGLENYRRFSRARSLAFERAFGTRFQASLPAACAVGTTAGPLALAFISGTVPPRHLENPLQVPAFEYPLTYGPRPPSFSRATVVQGERETEIFISGTAAIRGHSTAFANDLSGQLTCTLENLRKLSDMAGIPPPSSRSRWRRVFRIYLRRASDFPLVAGRLERELLQPGDSAIYLQADICRSDLLLEIEATFSLEH